MPSLASRLVPLYFRATRANRVYLTTAAAEARIEERRRHPTTAAPPRHLRRRFTISEDTSRGWPVFTVGPKHGTGTTIYLHGGAWVNEIAPQHWQLIGEIAGAGTSVVVPIYPLVPFGTAQQVLDAVLGLALLAADQHGPVSLAGDSAGGQLALSAALELKGTVATTVLIAPALDLAMRNPEMDVVQPSDPWLAKPGTRVFIESWRGDLPLLDPRVSPIEGDLTGLGRLVIFSGTRDILNPDARLLAERARAAGVDVEYHEGAGLVHVYPLLPTPEGRAARRIIVERLTA